MTLVGNAACKLGTFTTNSTVNTATPYSFKFPFGRHCKYSFHRVVSTAHIHLYLPFPTDFICFQNSLQKPFLTSLRDLSCISIPLKEASEVSLPGLCSQTLSLLPGHVCRQAPCLSRAPPHRGSGGGGSRAHAVWLPQFRPGTWVLGQCPFFPQGRTQQTCMGGWD